MVNTSHVYLNTPGSSFTDRKAIAKKCIESHQDKGDSIRRGKLRFSTRIMLYFLHKT